MSDGIDRTLRVHGKFSLSARAAHAAALGFEIAIIGGLLLGAVVRGRYVIALALALLPLVWRIAYAGVLTAVSQSIFHTPEATPVFSGAWFKLVASAGFAILRNQIGMAFPPRLSALPTAGTSTIVALIPGYSCNAGCFGTLPRRLSSHGFDCIAFEAGDPFGDLATNAAEAATWLASVARAAPGRPIILVGISMGGIVARLASVHPLAPRLAHLMTISSPHGGTWSAYFGVGAAAKQMQPNSAVLARLRSRSLICPATAIWTPDDAIILPPASGKLPGSETIAVAGYSHLAIVEAPAVEAAIVRAATVYRRSD